MARSALHEVQVIIDRYGYFELITTGILIGIKGKSQKTKPQNP